MLSIDGSSPGADQAIQTAALMDFYLEGDSAKRLHNPMLTRPGKPPERWHYTVSDRYGLYVCKDYIPLPPSQRVNDWVAGKSEWTLYHGFVNCQDFEPTANRAVLGIQMGNSSAKYEKPWRDCSRRR